MFFSRKPFSYQLKNDIQLSTRLEELTFTVFDTETTGFQVASTDRLLEIGAVQIKNLSVSENDKFHTYVNPYRQISREIMSLTGISEETVENAPSSFEAITSFFEFVKKQESVCFVGHYIPFDILTLKSELKKVNFTLKKQPTIDTLDLIGFIAPSFDMRDLQRYAMAFGTRIYDRHSAIGDALTTAYLFVELVEQLKERGYHTWGELLQATESQGRNLLF